MEEIDRFIGKTFGMSQAENSSEQSVSEFREKGMKTIQEQKQQETGHAIEHATPSSPYSSKWIRTRFSMKLETLAPLSPNLRTMKSARSCVSLLR